MSTSEVLANKLLTQRRSVGCLVVLGGSNVDDGIWFKVCGFTQLSLQLMRILVYLMLFDDGIPQHRTMAIPDAVCRFSSIFLDRLMIDDRLVLFVCPRAVK